MQLKIQTSSTLGTPIILPNLVTKSLGKVGGEIKSYLILCSSSPSTWSVLELHPNLCFGNESIVCYLNNGIKSYIAYHTKSK
jgi:hypothetical protein